MHGGMNEEVGFSLAWLLLWAGLEMIVCDGVGLDNQRGTLACCVGPYLMILTWEALYVSNSAKEFRALRFHEVWVSGLPSL